MPNLELRTLPGLHVDALITEERGSAGRNPSASRDTEPNISHQVEDAKDRSSTTGMPFAQVHLHVANEDNNLLIGPSGGKALSVTSRRRENTTGLAEGPLNLCERLTQNQPAAAPRRTTPNNAQSVGLGEKFTSGIHRGVSPGEPGKVNLLPELRIRGSTGLVALPMAAANVPMMGFFRSLLSAAGLESPPDRSATLRARSRSWSSDCSGWRCRGSRGEGFALPRAGTASS